MTNRRPTLYAPGDFEAESHFYPRVLNAQMHAMVRFFLSLTPERVIERYTYLNPVVDPQVLAAVFSTQCRQFRWAGCDLMHVTNTKGVRKMVVIESNSCPSGQKSMPLYEEHEEQGGYRILIEETFKPMLQGRRLPEGGLAVIFDKNEMEASGYAAAMADVFGEPVYLVPFHSDDVNVTARFDNGVLEVRHDDEWLPMRAAFRYVTQQPWNRIPLHTKTAIMNPVLACLAGGRNKMVAAKAYEMYNADLTGTGLSIRTPHTIWDVSLDEIPLWVRRLGGHAVIKVPYSNAGQGVFTITSQEELDRFMAIDHVYDRFIAQSLIGSYHWSSGSGDDRLFHVGTVPNKNRRSYVADLRVMVCSGRNGFRPLAIYGRRARQPLVAKLEGGESSWSILGTNLSVKNSDGTWASETPRLMLMDRKDFNVLGLSVDDLIEAYIQTMLATIAIDTMAQQLLNVKGRFRTKLFGSLNDDPVLLSEIVQ